MGGNGIEDASAGRCSDRGIYTEKAGALRGEVCKKKHERLWETRCSINERCNAPDTALPAMERKASPNVGNLPMAWEEPALSSANSVSAT